MAQRKLRVDHTMRGAVRWLDAVTNAEVLQCRFDTTGADADFLDAVIRYGIAQIVADGGAVGRDESFAAKVAGMRDRIEQIENETYRLGQRGGLVDGDVFRAMVALNKTSDTAENRAKWRNAKKSQRDVLRRDPVIAEWLRVNETSDIDTDAAVNTIFA